MKVGELWTKNTVGLLADSEYIDQGYILSIDNRLVFIASGIYINSDSYIKGTASVIPRNVFVRQYEKLKPAKYTEITAIDINGHYFACDRCNETILVEVTSVNTSSD